MGVAIFFMEICKSNSSLLLEPFFSLYVLRASKGNDSFHDLSSHIKFDAKTVVAVVVIVNVKEFVI